MVKCVMEYKQERYILNKFCEFRDKEVESSFMEYEKSTSLNIARFLVLIMGFIFAMFTLSDYYFYGNESTFPIAVGLRGAALFITIVVFSLGGKFKRYEHTLFLITLTELAVFFIFLLNLINLNNHDPVQHFMSVMLLILTVFLIPNIWKNCLIASCAIWICYIIFCAIVQPTMESPSLTQRGVYLGICLISCAIFLYGRESSQRRHFAAQQLLEYLSITDRLTGIYNRGRFEYVLGLWIKNMRHDPFCLLLFDIDNFKKVNDNHGHSAGDQVLVETTKIVSANIRDDDIFARWGGEEFVILFSNISLNRAVELAERLRIAVETNNCGEAGNVTISIGVVQYQREESIPDFVNRADGKMYEAKQAGKNRVIAETL